MGDYIADRRTKSQWEALRGAWSRRGLHEACWRDERCKKLGDEKLNNGWEKAVTTVASEATLDAKAAKTLLDGGVEATRQVEIGAVVSRVKEDEVLSMV